MRNQLFGSLRLAFALVCVGSTLLMTAQWLGYLPDTVAEAAATRRSKCQSLAIAAVPLIQDQQWVEMKRTLQRIIDENPEYLSIGFRSDLGTVFVDTGHHRELWSQGTADPPDPSVETAAVPMKIRHREVGQLEFCFFRPHQTAFEHIFGHPIVRLMAFFVVAGTFAYTLFVMRIMNIFSKTQVVPERVRQSLDTLAEGLLVLDEHGKIALTNDAFCRMIGQSAEEVEGTVAGDLHWILEESERDNFVFPWETAIEEEKIQNDTKLGFKTDSNGDLVLSVNAAPLENTEQARGALVTIRDVTHIEKHRLEQERMLHLLERSKDEITRQNKELEYQATRDALTGCFNRRAFFKQFDEMWKDAKTSNGKFLSCIMVDNDHFKSVNDTYGHHIGDEVLREVSACLRGLFEGFGLVCRYGGEEFCVLLPGYSAEHAVKVAEKAREAIAAIRLDDPSELRLTASLGVSELRFDADEPQSLINQADACLYVAKRNGRNQVVLFNPSINMEGEAEGDESEKKQVSRHEVPYKAVTALISTLAVHDPSRAEHSRRVANLCERVAEGIISPSYRYLLEVSALLHEVGQLASRSFDSAKSESLLEQLHSRLAPSLHEIHPLTHVIVDDAFACHELTMILKFYGDPWNDGDSPDDLDSEEETETRELHTCGHLLRIADVYDSLTHADPDVAHGEAAHPFAIEKLRSMAGQTLDSSMVDHFIQKIQPQTQVTGAAAIRNLASIEIGQRVAGVVQAMERRDLNGLRESIEEIESLSGALGFDEISDVAGRWTKQFANKKPVTEASAELDEESVSASCLSMAEELIGVCRSVQNQYVRQSLQRGEVVEEPTGR